MTQEIWVNTTEGSEITGYHRVYLQKLAHKNWKKPEEERLIRVRLRSNRYDIWLPDLINYIQEHGHGPQGKKQVKE
jgi:hypothetical protein